MKKIKTLTEIDKKYYEQTLELAITNGHIEVVVYLDELGAELNVLVKNFYN